MNKFKYDAVIVCTPNTIDYSNQSDYFIGTEEGCIDILNKNLLLSLAIGDFDHVNATTWSRIQQSAQRINQLPSDKDHIDGECAIRYARSIHKNKLLYIANGNDLDFIWGTLGLIKKYHISVQNHHSLAEPLSPGIHKFTKPVKYNYFSLLALSQATISIKGFDYEVGHLLMSPLDTKALRNTFRNAKASTALEVNVMSGSVVAIWTI